MHAVSSCVQLRPFYLLLGGNESLSIGPMIRSSRSELKHVPHRVWALTKESEHPSTSVLDVFHMEGYGSFHVFE